MFWPLFYVVLRVAVAGARLSGRGTLYHSRVSVRLPQPQPHRSLPEVSADGEAAPGSALALEPS